jgi:hypothetical protein
LICSPRTRRVCPKCGSRPSRGGASYPASGAWRPAI